MTGSRRAPRHSDPEVLIELAQLPDMNPGPVCRLDLQGVIGLANLAAVRAFGAEDLVGQCWLDVCPGMTPELWQRIGDDHDSVTHEADIRGCCFQFTHVHHPGAPSVFVYGADVTELRVAQQQLQEVARFPDMNPGPVVRARRDGTILLANRAARTLLARGEALKDGSWLTVCPGMTAARWAQIVASPVITHHETRVGDRSILFTHTAGEDVEWVFIYGADVTAQRNAEQALLQNEKMATLGTLAAGVAHELNNPGAAARRAAEQLEEAFATLQKAQLAMGLHDWTPDDTGELAALDGRARARATDPDLLDPLARSDREAALEEWLADHDAEDAWELAPALVAFGCDTDELEAVLDRFGSERGSAVIAWAARTFPVYQLLEEIRHGTKRLTEIVGALKEYSHVGRGEVHRVDVNQGIRHTLIILKHLLKAGVTVTESLADDLPQVEAFGSELNQVWTNLIDNAASAMEGTGALHLRSRRDGDDVVVEVEDDGPGIPHDMQTRIFDPFFTTKPPGQGTGLGLHTTMTIVTRKHHGKLTVASEPGRTVFTVRLPITGAGDAHKEGTV